MGDGTLFGVVRVRHIFERTYPRRHFRGNFKLIVR